MLAERLPTVGLVGTIFQLCCLFGIHVIRQQSKSSLSQALRGFSLSEKSHLKTEIKEPVVMMGFPGGTVVKKKSACQCSRHRTCGFNPWVGKVHWSRRWQPTPAFLPGKSHRGAWQATVDGVARRVRHDYRREHS